MKMVENEGEHFLEKNVTQDETWIPFLNPETKAQSKVWVIKGDQPPIKPNPFQE